MGPTNIRVAIKPRGNFCPAQISLMVSFAAQFTDQRRAGYFNRMLKNEFFNRLFIIE
jgi:hypothetical protein